MRTFTITQISIFWGILTATSLPGSTEAGTTVYKCVVNGQTTLTDKPCSGENPDVWRSQTSTTVVASSKDPSPVGRWSGQIQYSEVSNGQAIQAAHSVALMNAEFTADGKVTGLSSENGCQMLGVWSSGGQTLAWVDLTLDQCRISELNRRYHGSFILARPDSSGQLQKSVRWAANDVKKVDLFTHLLRRDSLRVSKRRPTGIELGSAEKLREIREMSRVSDVRVAVYVVQPGLSKAQASNQQLELISVTENYLKETYQLRFGIVASA
jgi:hypothetical protein